MVAVIRLDSPPLARGAHDVLGDNRTRPGLTPACAGSTKPTMRIPAARWTHPRLRGEHAAPVASRQAAPDSPPLARGAQPQHDHDHPPRGLTPACAGSTSSASTHAGSGWTHPRLRGEHRCVQVSGASEWDSPPLARGAPRQEIERSPFTGPTPPCAGSTPPTTSSPPRKRTHPRLRGEHESGSLDDYAESDSPPLARGARRGGDRGARRCGLTPACAGSTPA